MSLLESLFFFVIDSDLASNSIYLISAKRSDVAENRQGSSSGDMTDKSDRSSFRSELSGVDNSLQIVEEGDVASSQMELIAGECYSGRNTIWSVYQIHVAILCTPVI